MAAGSVVNIRRDVDDKFYRYRMPLLLTKIEGKGNGIKTVIPNMSDVARALSRPPTYPTKFFGCELGAQTSFDEKGDRYIVNGAHDATRLRELLDSFIDKFVLCAACKNPETDLIIGKDDNIIRDCKACGQRTPVDMRHKLTTFITKNPPKNPKKSKGSKKGTDSPSNGAHAAADNQDIAAEADAADGDTDDELTKRIKTEAADLAPSALQQEDWSADTSAAAVNERIQALQGSLQSSLLIDGDDDDDDDESSPYTILGAWAVENRDTAKAVDVYRKAQELGIEKKPRAVLVLVQSLFTKKIVSEIPAYAPMFVKMVTSEKHQKALLGGVERFVGIEHEELIPQVPSILMAFYQGDVLEEEVVTQWSKHVSKKYVDKDTCKRVRKASAPFISWLQEAGSEDSEESDDE